MSAAENIEQAAPLSQPTFDEDPRWELVFITGASKGIGSALATVFAGAISRPIHFVLTGRDVAGLESTRDSILNLRQEKHTLCDIEVIDFSLVDSLPEKANELFAKLDSTKYKRIFYVNNAAILGAPGYIGSQSDVDGLRDAIRVNSIAPYVLLAHFMNKYQQMNGVHLRAVNITSYVALDPAVSISHYCSTKACTEMLFNVLAVEQQSSPFVKVLNYAPGVLYTDLTKYAMAHENLDMNIRVNLEAMRVNGQMVDTRVSAEKCVNILLQDAFTSGVHIDYFDDEDQSLRTIPTR